MTESRDLLSFLDPWTLLLPEGGGRVLAAVGSGGKSQVLARLYRHYRSEGQRVLWTQTVAHPPPAGLEAHSADEPDRALAERLAQQGAIFVGGVEAEEGLPGAVSLERIESLRQGLRPDIVLVEAHAPCGTPLRQDEPMPVWPRPLHLAIVVVGLHGVGRLWGPSSVAGASPETTEDGEPRRVRSEDALAQLSGRDGMIAQVPDGLPVLPFLTGFGAYRDIDGMFALVAELWEDSRLRAVLLGELVGETRIDEAERAQAAQAPTGAAHLEGERVYALYPAHLDDEG